MSDFIGKNALDKFEQEISSLSLSGSITTTKSSDILFDTTTNYEEEEEDSDALEEAANQFFEQFNIVKTDFKHPCPAKVPFTEFKKDLIEVSTGVYKKIIKQGRGDVIDVEQSVVTYEFAMFLEGSTTPYDSSFINKHPGVISSGAGVLPGIFQALSTMKHGESADFWIHSRLMFGFEGCAPRVPPSADIVLHLKVIAVKQLKPLEESEDEAEPKTPFIKMLKTAMKDYEKARLNFKNGNYRKCIDIYRHWIDRLEFARLANENDERKQKQFLAKLYQNAAVCYIKVNRPERTCIMIRELEKLQPIRENAKALLAKGRAKMLLLDYETARRCLTLADFASPGSTSVAEALNELNKREAEKFKFEQESALLQKKADQQIQRREQKILEGMTRRGQDQRSVECDALRFGGELTELIDGFKSDSATKFLSLTTASKINTPRHLKVAENLCNENNILLKGYQDDIDNQVHYYLSK